MRLYLRTEQQEEKALREVASGISVEDNAKKIIIIKGKTFECAERRENDWENYPAKERCHGQCLFLLVTLCSWMLPL